MQLTGFRDFLKSNKIYNPSQLKEVLKEVRPNFRFSHTNTKVKYFNVPCSFDIETSSFFRSTGKGKEQQKIGIMYEWTFGIYGLVIIGREWDEFFSLLNELSEILQLNENKRLICYVHSLSYEFQFIRKWLMWNKVFSIDTREPIYALSSLGIEFRCSYLLSGYRLEKLGDELQSYEVKKLVGNLNYDLLRHSKTPLTPDEIAYCVNDVKVVMGYIAERIEQDNGLSYVPLTKTGYVRKYCRNSCFFEPGEQRNKSFKRLRYLDTMRGLRIIPNEYTQLKYGFQGGFTHTNPFHSGKLLHDVTSFDFCSSYPTSMIAELYPMSSGEKVEITSKQQFKKNLELYCCIFDVEFEGLESLCLFENYLSESKCREKRNVVVDNGRVVSAEHLVTTITDVDYTIIRKFYKCKHMRVGNFRRYKRGYLPTDFVKSILKLYKDKTELKGVDDKVIEYGQKKEMLNSTYGMCVTDIVRDEYPYTDEWEKPKAPNAETALKKYNNSSSRFLFYPWGIFCTAYSRRNLFTGILEFRNDYVYSDTDSIKVLHADKHMDYINKYNSKIREQLQRAMIYHGIDISEIEPKNKDGQKKCLGVWEFDGHYEDFKALGAKRYLVKYSQDERNKEKNRGKYALTVAGLNKDVCMPYLLKEYGEDGVFDAFNEGLKVPPEYTGKMTHTYIDEPREGVVVDYLGNPGYYYEKSCIHLEKSDYSLSISEDYSSYLADIKTIAFSG